MQFSQNWNELSAVFPVVSCECSVCYCSTAERFLAHVQGVDKLAWCVLQPSSYPVSTFKDLYSYWLTITELWCRNSGRPSRDQEPRYEFLKFRFLSCFSSCIKISFFLSVLFLPIFKFFLLFVVIISVLLCFISIFPLFFCLFSLFPCSSSVFYFCLPLFLFVCLFSLFPCSSSVFYFYLPPFLLFVFFISLFFLCVLFLSSPFSLVCLFSLFPCSSSVFYFYLPLFLLFVYSLYFLVLPLCCIPIFLLFSCSPYFLVLPLYCISIFPLFLLFVLLISLFFVCVLFLSSPLSFVYSPSFILPFCFISPYLRTLLFVLLISLFFIVFYFCLPLFLSFSLFPCSSPLSYFYIPLFLLFVLLISLFFLCILFLFSLFPLFFLLHSFFLSVLFLLILFICLLLCSFFPCCTPLLPALSSCLSFYSFPVPWKQTLSQTILLVWLSAFQIIFLVRRSLMYWKQLSMKIYFINRRHLAASLNKVPYMQNTLADCWQNAGKANDTGSGGVGITPKYLHWTVMTQRGSLL